MGNIYKCPRNTCKGGRKKSYVVFNNSSNNETTTSYVSCWVYGNYNNSVCIHNEEDLQCEEGAIGPLCGSCEQDYTYNAVLNACERCRGDGDINILYYVGLIILIFIILVYFIYLYCGQSYFIQLLRSIDIGSLKILIVTYQIIVSSSFYMNIKVSYILKKNLYTQNIQIFIHVFVSHINLYFCTYII